MGRRKVQKLPLIPALNGRSVAEKATDLRTKEIEVCRNRITALLTEYGCSLVPDIMQSFDGAGGVRQSFQVRVVG